ncbi:CPBP family intramembrane metalloprotease [Nocardiopsis dassonvillei]|uniref:CPBP family intramembrane glutamic endopeptidase n=1 Tax=Nocardiopsis dassonvillei TaxID=2014 RepID=UPI00102C7473|nr:CPBP family intramembrane glutamic endopeptidase [Nocardiopsis dassonvillei]MCP3016175.1 CPBP family intramembrane metalloprotease [Nocardiopsis dassonvillei]
MPWSESLPQFSLAGTVLTVLLLLFAALGEPLLGRKAFTWLSRRRDGDARALTLLHAVTMGIHVLWGLVVFGVLLLSPNLVAADLGLRLPDAWGPIAGGAVGGLLALTVFWLLVNGLPKGPGRSGSGHGRGGRPARGRRAQGASARGRRSSAPLSLPEPERDRGLLAPRTTAERAMAAGVAVTGGVFGELLYRGLFILLVASMGVPLWIAAALSVLLFSVAHLYQGWWGLVSAGASGTLFTVLYLGTGSVWVPVLVHVALNLRSLVFPPADVREAGEREHREEEGEPEAYDEYDEYEHHSHGYEDGPATGEQPLTGAEEDGGADTAVAPAPPGTGTPAHGTPSHGAVSGYGGAPGHGGTSIHGDPYGHSGDPGHGGHSAHGDLPARSADFGPGGPHTDSGPHTRGGAFEQDQQDLYSGLSTSGPSSGHDDPLGGGGLPGYGDRFGGGDQGGHGGQPAYGGHPGHGGHRSDGTLHPAPSHPGPSHGGPPHPAPPYPGPSRPGPLPPHGAPAGPSHDDLPGGIRRDEGRGERRPYPDEWIDRRYGDANTTPGSAPDRWS